MTGLKGPILGVVLVLTATAACNQTPESGKSIHQPLSADTQELPDIVRWHGSISALSKFERLSGSQLTLSQSNVISEENCLVLARHSSEPDSTAYNCAPFTNTATQHDTSVSFAFTDNLDVAFEGQDSLAELKSFYQ